MYGEETKAKGAKGLAGMEGEFIWITTLVECRERRRPRKEGCTGHFKRMTLPLSLDSEPKLGLEAAAKESCCIG